MISILLLSWNRFDLLKKTLDWNLETIGCAYELLVADQGSTDERVIPYLKSKNPAYLRENKRNEGVNRSFNQLYLRSTRSIIVTMPNDILYPKDWGVAFVKWLTFVEHPGLCCIDCGQEPKIPLSTRDGIAAHWAGPGQRVFGPLGLTREFIQELGFFCEWASRYGKEDSDLNDRAALAGRRNFYIPGLFARHLGTDEHDVGSYREGKDADLADAERIFNDRNRMLKCGMIPLKVAMPEKRDPIV